MYHRGGGASQYPNNNNTNTGPSGGGGHFNSGPGASGTSSNNSWSNADTCASLFPRTRKLKVDIEMSLDALDTPRGGLDEVMMTRLTRDLSQFFMNIEQMQELLSKEYNQRGMWQKRIANMRDAYRSLKHTYDREMSQWDRRIRDANNRTELFGSSDTSAETKSRANDLNNERDMLLKSLDSGNQTAQWLGTLSSHIGTQGDRLKGVQRGLVSMAGTLGLSDSVIQMINRREFMDRLLLVALMILTLIVFLLCYWYM